MVKDNLIWDLYTSKIEYNQKYKDSFQRNLSNFSHTRDILNPYVTDYLFSNGFNPVYPENKDFGVCISHDVDLLIRSAERKELIKSIIKFQPGKFKIELGRYLFSKIDDEWNLLNILALDNKYGMKSTYYFLSLESSERDFNYSLEQVDTLFGEIRKYGNEIGLHGSQTAYNDIFQLKTQKERLERYTGEISGYRNHFLKFEVPDTWRVQSEAGIKYDTTFGFPDCPGFRNGMCYPFQPYDNNKNGWLDIYEIPLILMDVSLFNYLRMDYETAFSLFKNLVLTVKRFRGVFTLLWHNNLLEGKMGEFYERCIEYLYTMNAYSFRGQELIEWWEKNNYFEEQKEILKKLTSN